MCILLHGDDSFTQLFLTLAQLGLVIVGDCKLSPLDLMPALHFAVVHHLSGLDAWTCFCLVVVIHGTAGYWVAFSALIATHQHPHLFHMGDGPLPSRDWGLQQMDAVRDVRGKSRSLFLAATTFGDHLLHHLFPTVDHSKLQLLYPALKACLISDSNCLLLLLFFVLIASVFLFRRPCTSSANATTWFTGGRWWKDSTCNWEGITRTPTSRGGQHGKRTIKICE